MPAFNEWHRLSQPFLDTAKTRDDYLAAFLAELGKVRVPTGEGDTLNKARENVSKLPPSELPIIPGMPGAPESWRRLTALHGELSLPVRERDILPELPRRGESLRRRELPTGPYDHRRSCAAWGDRDCSQRQGRSEWRKSR